MEKGFDRVVNESKSSPTIERHQPIDLQNLQMGLSTYFDDLPDPRVDRTKQHLLKDILVITILATIAGAQGWEDIENYGLSKQQWLEEFLELPNGIPSDDTFRRVFERLDPKVLEQKLSQWLQQIMGSVFPEIIPIDGKSLRGSYDREKGLKNLHLVTAWASEQRLVLGQVKVEDHSNEITAIPALLELIDISGAIITKPCDGDSNRNSPTDSSEKSRLCRGTKKQSSYSLQSSKRLVCNCKNSELRRK